MFFSASTPEPNVKRTIGIARTNDLNGSWHVEDRPIVPLDEQIENSSIHYEATTALWFLFTNHNGINEQRQEYTDAIWVSWSNDLEKWDPENKAIVLDGKNCTWSRQCIAMRMWSSVVSV